MKNNPLVSIILRSYNEEKWIAPCLDAILQQDYKNYEIILVDNKSSDLTVSKAKQYPVTILNIDDFKPGLALNLGIRASKGEYFVCLSSHCIPTNENWLSNLLKNFNDEKVAAVYGRQEPMSFTSDMDKRDLLTVFGLDRKIQWKDSFFHNANSMIRRDLWEKIPFDEEISNIEDRLWAREVLRLKEYCIVYEPEASVYHWHGIHQNQDPERCANVVRIIEGLNREDGEKYKPIGLDNLKVAAIIPAKGDVLYVGNKSLLELTVECLKKSKYIKDIILSTDSEEFRKLGAQLGIKKIIGRSSHLSKEFVDLMSVYQDVILKLEKENIIYDVVVPVEMTFPFRDEKILDQMIEVLVRDGHDLVMPAKAEFGTCFQVKDKKITTLVDGFVPRSFKEPMWIGLKGIGFATYPGRIVRGNLGNLKFKYIELKNSLSQIEVRNKEDTELAFKLLSLAK